MSKNMGITECLPCCQKLPPNSKTIRIWKNALYFAGRKVGKPAYFRTGISANVQILAPVCPPACVPACRHASVQAETQAGTLDCKQASNLMSIQAKPQMCK